MSLKAELTLKRSQLLTLIKSQSPMPKPFVRELKDGTFQVTVDIPGHGLSHVVKDGFTSEKDAQHWIDGEEGKSTVQQFIARFSKG